MSHTSELPQVSPIVPSDEVAKTLNAVQLPEDLSEKAAATHSTHSHGPVKQFGGKMPRAVILAIGMFILVAGIASAMYLSSKSSELRQQASGGYHDCAGGVKDGDASCSGYREIAVCHNGAFTSGGTCSSSQKCFNGACVLESSTGGSGAPTSTGNPNSSSTPIGSGTPRGSGTPIGSGAPTGSGSPIGTGGPISTGFPTGTGFPRSSTPPNSTVHTCGTGDGLWSTGDTSQPANSTKCFWQGDYFYKCNSGFENKNNGCSRIGATGGPIATNYPVATTIPEEHFGCGTGDGLWDARDISQPSNSTKCIWQGSYFYKCNSGYVNQNNGCAQQSAVTSDTTSAAANTCGTGDGLFEVNDNIANSTACKWKGADYRKCNTGYLNNMSKCAPAAQLLTYQIVGDSPETFECKLCENQSRCTTTLSTCMEKVAVAKQTVACYQRGNCSFAVYRAKECLSNEYLIQEECSAAGVQANTDCQTGVDLFLGQIDHTVICSGANAGLYRCADGYINKKNRCVTPAEDALNAANLTCYHISNCNLAVSTSQRECGPGELTSPDECRRYLDTHVVSLPAVVARNQSRLEQLSFCYMPSDCNTSVPKDQCTVEGFWTSAACKLAYTKPPASANGTGSLNGASLSGE